MCVKCFPRFLSHPPESIARSVMESMHILWDNHSIEFEHGTKIRKSFFLVSLHSNIILFIVTLWQNTAINVAEWYSMCKRIIFGTSNKNCIWFSYRAHIHIFNHLIGLWRANATLNGCVSAVLHVFLFPFPVLFPCANFDQSAHHLSHKCFGAHIYSVLESGDIACGILPYRYV